MEKPQSRTIFEIIGALIGLASIVFNFYLGMANNNLTKENQSQVSYEKTMESLTELIKQRDEYYASARQIIEADALRDGAQIKSHINDLNIRRESFIRFLKDQKYAFFQGIDTDSIATPGLEELLSKGVLRERLEKELDTDDLEAVQKFVEFANTIDERWVVLESRSDFTLRSSPQTADDNIVATFTKGTVCRLLSYTREVSWYYVRVSAGESGESTGWVWKPLLSSPRQGPFS
jgi:hypothetical protein